MHVHVEQQWRLTDVLHDGTVVLLSNTHTYTHSGVRLQASRQVSRRQLQTDRQTVEARRRTTHRVEPLQEDVVSQQDVGLHQILVVGVDAGANAAVCRTTGQGVKLYLPTTSTTSHTQWQAVHYTPKPSVTS